MALFKDEKNVGINGNDKKRKNIEVAEKVKKNKINNTIEFNEESDEVIKTVKKKKNKHVQIETNEEPDTVEVLVEKVKKKKNKHVQIETNEEPDAVEVVVEKVKKKKKNKNPEVTEVNDANDDEPTGSVSFNSTEGTESKPKSKKVTVLPTVTIAVPGSILDNAQSPEFRTYLAGQIARAACIYKIDEVCSVVFL